MSRAASEQAPPVQAPTNGPRPGAEHPRQRGPPLRRARGRLVRAGNTVYEVPEHEMRRFGPTGFYAKLVHGYVPASPPPSPKASSSGNSAQGGASKVETTASSPTATTTQTQTPDAGPSQAPANAEVPRPRPQPLRRERERIVLIDSGSEIQAVMLDRDEMRRHGTSELLAQRAAADLIPSTSTQTETSDGGGSEPIKQEETPPTVKEEAGSEPELGQSSTVDGTASHAADEGASADTNGRPLRRSTRKKRERTP